MKIPAALILLALGSPSIRAQLLIYNPTFTGTAQSDLALGSHTITGGTWNGPSQLVQLDSSGRLPAADGSLLTRLNWSQLGGRPSSLAGDGIADPVAVSSGGALPALAGTSLTALNASSLASGTVADALLSGNIPRLNATNTWSADQAFQPHLLDAITATAAARWLRVAT